MRISDWSSDVCSSDLDDGTVLMAAGKIIAVGADVAVPSGVRVIDGRSKWVTPGIIDAHSHLGVFPAPGVQGHADGNENIDRSEERRVGKECVSTCCSRWSPYH